MAADITSAAATTSYTDPLSQTPSSASSATPKSDGQYLYLSSPLSPSANPRRPLSRDFSETSVMSTSSNIALAEEEGGEGELSQLRNGSGAAAGWMAHHASTDHLHSPGVDGEEEGDPIIPSNQNNGKADGRGKQPSAYTDHANGYGRNTSFTLEDETDTDEQREAKQIQSNLERWAAAERQRRKAARTSRGPTPFASDSTSGGVLSGGPSALARRLTFGRKNTANHLPLSTAPPGSGLNAVNSRLLRKGSTSNSISSSAGSELSELPNGENAIGSGRGIELTSSLQDVPEDDRDDGHLSGYTSDASSSVRRKGKSRAIDGGEDSPGRDLWSRPTAGAQRLAADAAYDRHGARSPLSSPERSMSSDKNRRSSVSMKPSASRPIVTPGRAASIRRTAPNPPKIVVAAEGTNTVDAKNPFITRNELAAATATGNSAKEKGVALRQTIPEDDEGIVEEEGANPFAPGKPKIDRRGTSETVMTISSTVTARPGQNGEGVGSANLADEDDDEKRLKRFSTSSKFREVGLESHEDDLSTAGGDHPSLRGDDYDDEDPSSRRAYSMASPMDYTTKRLSRPGRSRREEEMADEDRRIIREGRGRQTWWTEWLCGCGRVIDDDNEQTGKTGPE